MNKIYINKQSLLLNLKHIKKISGSRKVIAVLKANAYAHNVKMVVSVIDKKVAAYAVSNLEEAIELRSYTEKDIMVLSSGFVDNLSLYYQNDIIISVDRISAVRNILKIAKQKNCKFKLQIITNTGMNRFGVGSYKIFIRMLEIIYNNQQYLCLTGVYSHLASSLSEDEFLTKKQIKKFNNFVSILRKYKFLSCKYVHLVSSKNLSLAKKTTNAVRVGIALYNIKKPVIKVCGNILKILVVKTGECVGYGNAFKAKTAMKIGVVSVGYADGYLRTNSNNSRVIINDCYCNVVGNICMDCFMVDLTAVKNVKVNDEVIVLGRSATKEVLISELAKQNTIDYEVYTNFIHGRFKYVLE